MMQRLTLELCSFILVWLIILWHSVVAAAGSDSVISSRVKYNSNVYRWTTSLETETYLTLPHPKNLELFPQRSYFNPNLRAALNQNVSVLRTGDTFHAAF